MIDVYLCCTAEKKFCKTFHFLAALASDYVDRSWCVNRARFNFPQIGKWQVLSRPWKAFDRD